VRKILLVVLVLGLAGSVFAQTSMKNRDSSPLLVTSATTMQQDGSGMRMMGSVSFTFPDRVVVTADEAFVNPTTKEIELRGNVRMKLTMP
jgi:lipopolysaccharide assembly outer membrane protein LptD (OstA)